MKDEVPTNPYLSWLSEKRDEQHMHHGLIVGEFCIDATSYVDSEYKDSRLRC